MGRPAVLKVDIIADARKVGPGVAEAESKLGRLGKAGKVAGAAAAAGLAAGAAAAGAFALDSIKSASAVQQSFGALETIYGRNSEQVKKWAATAADQVGLAKSEYANLSALVGSQLQGMGQSQEQSAQSSNKLIKLGADLAATYGGSVSDAVGAVSSLLKGERDPIERYGVSLKAADVSAALAARGLDNLTGKAAKQAEAQVTLELLTQQTAKTQGAFSRESNTLAGQQERLSAKFENLKATLGERLLPVATKVVGWVSNKMLPGALKLGRTLTKTLGPAFRTVAGFITKTAIPAARGIYNWFVERVAPQLRRALTPVLRGVQSAFRTVADAIKRNEPELRTLLSFIGRVVEVIARRLAPILGRIAGGALRTFGRAIGGVIDFVSDLVGWVDSAIDKVGDLISYIRNIRIPDIDIPFIGGSVSDLVTRRVELVGPSPSLDGRRSWSTAAGGSAPLGSSLRTLGAAPAVSVTGGDTYTITVAGALDPVAVADQVDKLLRRRARRVRRVAGVAW